MLREIWNEISPRCQSEHATETEAALNTELVLCGQTFPKFAQKVEIATSWPNAGQAAPGTQRYPGSVEIMCGDLINASTTEASFKPEA